MNSNCGGIKGGGGSYLQYVAIFDNSRGVMN